MRPCAPIPIYKFDEKTGSVLKNLLTTKTQRTQSISKNSKASQNFVFSVSFAIKIDFFSRLLARNF